MQTFLPYADFARSATVLDTARLGKQRVECKQIWLALADPTYGWQHHPAVKMWRARPDDRAAYALAMCAEWTRRGYHDNLADFFAERASNADRATFDDRVYASHRSNLLRKLPAWYSQFGWSESPDLPYFWPI